jgi:membrane-bound lytic murein transglycosylase D
MFTKGKLYKIGIVAASFIFMAATPGRKDVISYADATASCRIMLSDSSLRMIHAFDAEGLCTCLPELSHEEMTHAPRTGLNKQAAAFINEYNGKNDFYLAKIKAKSAPYFKIIDEVFSQYNLPVELKYLAVIESKLDNKIVSGAGAAGLWQLMPSAARSFGLKVNGKNDERKNSNKSTVAAAKCLTYLHNMFDDWLLTLAAYNCGPGGVLKAIKKSGSRNFWVLQNYLPLETRKHVKKFIAMHYYFEGHGSLTTLTKAETKTHIDAVASFVKKQEEQKADTLLAKTEAVTLSNK